MEKWLYGISDGFTNKNNPRATVNEAMAHKIYIYLKNHGALVCDCDSFKAFTIGESYHKLIRLNEEDGNGDFIRVWFIII